MKGVQFLVAFVVLALASSLASASDPSPLQDFCVAIEDYKNGVFVNGKFCKDPKLATPNDFFFSGLDIPRNTSNPVGSTVTPVNVAQIAGLNTLGVSLVRIDYAPYGQNAPHTHPRASEILFVQEGTLYVGFEKTDAVAFAGLSSQNPGVITIANAVFGSDPAINPDFLARAFQLDLNVVKSLQEKFWWDSN
ncbi:hypothetical protein LWI28_018030 [Acer negundo]|uniref:Cupin type-1 domain-containing protein n=1 Tax=Acer negundo TaxID=4023 RepID=A0AAD5JA47_ACENE|nr:hypothetical protein LWI28_018030 [Acer negundo]